MRLLRSLIWGLVGFALFLASGLAFAQTGDRYSAVTFLGKNGFGVDQVSACQNLVKNLVGASSSTYTFARAYIHPSVSGAGACYGYRNGSTNEEVLGNIDVGYCPKDRPYFSNLTCTATKPAPAETPDLCADKNPIVRRWNYPASGPYSAPGSYAGCVVTAVEMMVCRKSATGSYCMWMVKRTGDKFTGEDKPGVGGNDSPEVPADPPVKSPPIENPPKPTDDPGKGPCPAGTVHAGMSLSGIPMCIGTGSTPPAKPVQPKTETEKNETAADGTITNTKTVITTNADGSTTKTVTVTATKPDGTKTTSGTADTSTTPTGAAGKADRPTEDDKYDLCKTNPNLSVCREGSVTGTCGQIQCVGDAVQCATLRAAAAMECRGKADEDALKAMPQTALGNQILSGADPMKAQIDTAMKGTEVDLSKTELDQSAFLGGGSCLADKTLSVLGRPVTVKFAQLCTNIQPLRGVIMACAFILAYMIVSRSVLQG
jgi:hypothetical protein